MASVNGEYQSVAVDDPATVPVEEPAPVPPPPANEYIQVPTVLPLSHFPTDIEQTEQTEHPAADSSREFEYPEDWLVGIFYFFLGALLLSSVNAFNSSRFARFFPPELYLQSLSVSGLRVSNSSLAADFTAEFFLYNNNWGSSVTLDGVEVSVLYYDDTVLGTAKSGQEFGLGPMSAREAEMNLERTGEVKAHEPAVGLEVLRRIKDEVETDRVLSLGLRFKMTAEYNYGKDGGRKKGAEVMGECLGVIVEMDPEIGIGSWRFDFGGMECAVFATFEDDEASQL
ncbi:unnamed protein product [Linum trigynum]|uniref:Late embryogenesis abundant protein LEA-2 subgroup domain-containing protein n=1 Tax=Linum trigynum TaxID=586398 RepID=A0AAV2CVQ9_9ROSI